MAYLGNAPVVGDSTNSFKLLDDIQSFTVTFDATDTDVVSIANNTLTFRNHRFITGQRVTYNDGGGTAIGGLADGVYFIIKVDQNTIQLATNASNAASSTAIDLTSGAAGGSHTLNVAFDGVNTKFKATHSNGTKAGVSRAGQLSLSINGVIQQPQDNGAPTVGYGIQPDSTIIFSTPPASVDKVFGTFIGEAAASFDIDDNTVDNFTGDGSTVSFNLSKDVPSSNDVLVTLDGVTQYPTDSSTVRAYSVIESTLTFVSAPDAGVAIQVRHIGFAGASSSAVTGFYGRTGNAALRSTDDISVQNISGVGATFTSNVNIEGVLTYEDVTNVDSVGLITARSGISVSGGDIKVGSATTLSQDNIFTTGIVTATSFSGSGANLTGIDTDLVSDTSPQLGGNLDVNSKNIIFANSGGANDDRLIFGGGNDLQIFFDGTNSRVQGLANTQKLKLGGPIVEIVDEANAETMAKFTSDGASELYYDNSKKFETTSAGVTVTGHLTVGTATLYSTGNLLLGDSDEIRFGAGEDLKIYHGGTDSHITNSTGQLKIAGDTIRITNAAVSETQALFTADGNVELYSNDVKRFQTRSGGGAADGIVVYGSSSNTAVNLFTDSTNRGTVYANSSNSVGFLDAGGDWAIKHTNDSQTEFYVQTNRKAAIDADGLKFNNDTAAANALDDYEEGNFTPTVNSIASPNYTVAAGRYTKIGNLVTAQVYLLMASGGGEGSVFSIGSLPFTSTNTTYKEGGGSIIYENGFFDNSSTVSPKNTCTVWVPANNTIIQFHKRYNGAAIWGNDTSFGTGANNVYLIVQVCYVAA